MYLHIHSKVCVIWTNQRLRHTKNSQNFFALYRGLVIFILPRAEIVAETEKILTKVVRFSIFILGSVTCKRPVMLPTKTFALLVI